MPFWYLHFAFFMKSISKKIFFLAAIFLAVGNLAFGCGYNPSSGNAETVELVIWKPFEGGENLRPIFEAYTKLHPNVTFRYEKKDISTYESDLLNALAAGSGPDIFSIHNDWLPKYQDKMTPTPANLFTAREFSDTFIDVIGEDLVGGDGRLYALPLAMDTLALYYNRDLLGSAGIATPPATWAEVVAGVKKLTQQDRLGNFTVSGIAMGTSGNINRSTDILSLLMLQNGTQIYDSSQGSATMSRETAAPDGSRYSPGVQALDFYTQFSNPAKETYTWNVKNNQSVDAFVAGQTAMILSYSYMEPVIKSKAPLLNFGIAPAPQIDSSKPKVNFANYYAEGVSRGSPNAAAAWDFLKFATSAESLQAYYSLHKQAAVRKDLISTQIADSDIGVFAEGALTAKTFYKPDAPAVEGVLSRMIDDVVLRNKSTQNAVSTGNQSLDDLIR